MTILIAIVGGSGSGKTSIARRLMKDLGPKASYLAYDNYYKDLSHLPFSERTKLNFDHPSMLDEKLFEDHLKMLKKGEMIQVPQWDFASHTRTGNYTRFEPTEIVLVDGILAMHVEDQHALFDYRVFVKADSDLRLARRILRDTKERGRTLNSVINQYLSTVKPMHLRYVEPCRYRSDFVLHNNKNGDIDKNEYEVLLNKINNLVVEKN